ncbi:hypothetical protein IC582_015363 [Cucumis melo]
MFLLVRKQKILTLQISVHKSFSVTFGDCSRDVRCSSFGVVPSRYNPIEKLVSLTKLHNLMNIIVIPVSRFKLYYIRMFWQFDIIATSRLTSSISTAVLTFLFDIDLQAKASFVFLSVHRYVIPNSPRPSSSPSIYLSLIRVR